MTQQLEHLSKLLNLQFNDISLLRTALTHRSASADNYERLEFLGDGALNFIIASELYRLKPSYNEGFLSRLRANLVRGKTLSEIARELNLGNFLHLGPGELKSGGFLRDSILSDVVEAIIGAVYLDAGFQPCRLFVLSLFKSRLHNLPDVSKLIDPKTRLQEYLQGQGGALPIYSTLEITGKAHEQTFRVECYVEKFELRCESVSTSRRKAEQGAALVTLEQLLQSKNNSQDKQ